MEDKSKPEKISRRNLFPLLGGALLMPFLGSASPSDNSIESEDENEAYETLLKPDGTTVKVKVSTLKKSKVIKKNVSNKSLLTWLGKKF